MPVYNKPEDAGDGLHTLLLRAAPENKHGNKTLTTLADELHLSRWAVRKWINAGKLSPERAMQVVRLSEGRVKIEEFHDYVYKE